MSDDCHEYDEEVFTAICEVSESLVLGDPLYKKGFEAGAASRDAEVVSLTNQRDYEYVRAENAEQERDQFEQVRDQHRAQINVLREALEYCVTQVGELATVPGIASALSSIPEQSLAAYRNKVIEECAERAEAYAYMSQNFNALAEELRAMKEQP